MTKTKTETKATAAYLELPIDQVEVGENDRPVGDVSDLAESIREVGILQPLLVTTNGDGVWLVVAGRRRLAAAREAGLQVVPCLAKPEQTADETAVRVARLVENIHRRDLSPIEEAQAYKALVGDLGSQRKVAARLGGVTQAHISKRLALLELPDAVQQQIGVEDDSSDGDRGIRISEAQELAKLRDHPNRLEHALEAVERQGLGVEDAVRGQLRDLDRVQRREAKIAELRDDGHVVYDADDIHDSWGLTRLKGAKGKPKPRQVAWHSWDGVDMDPDEHAKLDCHALAVLHDGDHVAVCTNPPAHGGTKKEQYADDRQRKDKRQEKKEAAKRREQLAGATARRRAHCRQIFADPMAKAALDFVAHMAMTTPLEVESFAAAQLLDLAPEDAEQDLDFDPQQVLWEHAAKSRKQLHAAALATVIGTIEDSLDRPGWLWRQDETKAYFEFLEANGYKPAPIEKKLLEGKS